MLMLVLHCFYSRMRAISARSNTCHSCKLCSFVFGNTNIAFVRYKRHAVDNRLTNTENQCKFRNFAKSMKKLDSVLISGKK